MSKLTTSKLLHGILLLLVVASTTARGASQCGNGRVDAGEECDPTADIASGGGSDCCTLDCRRVPEQTVCAGGQGVCRVGKCTTRQQQCATFNAVAMQTPNSTVAGPFIPCTSTSPAGSLLPSILPPYLLAQTQCTSACQGSVANSPSCVNFTAFSNLPAFAPDFVGCVVDTTPTLPANPPADRVIAAVQAGVCVGGSCRPDLCRKTRCSDHGQCTISPYAQSLISQFASNNGNNNGAPANSAMEMSLVGCGCDEGFFGRMCQYRGDAATTTCLDCWPPPKTIVDAPAGQLGVSDEQYTSGIVAAVLITFFCMLLLALCCLFLVRRHRRRQQADIDADFDGDQYAMGKKHNHQLHSHNRRNSEYSTTGTLVQPAVPLINAHHHPADPNSNSRYTPGNVDTWRSSGESDEQRRLKKYASLNEMYLRGYNNENLAGGDGKESNNNTNNHNNNNDYYHGGNSQAPPVAPARRADSLYSGSVANSGNGNNDSKISGSNCSASCSGSSPTNSFTRNAGTVDYYARPTEQQQSDSAATETLSELAVRLDHLQPPKPSDDKPSPKARTSRTSPGGLLSCMSHTKPQTAANANADLQQQQATQHSPKPLLPIHLPESYLRAVHHYQPRLDDEIELVTNDLLYVIKTYDDGWARALNLRSGKEGIFPLSFVQRVVVPPEGMGDANQLTEHQAQILAHQNSRQS